MALDVVDQPHRSLEQHFPGAGRSGFTTPSSRPQALPVHCQ